MTFLSVVTIDRTTAIVLLSVVYTLVGVAIAIFIIAIKHRAGNENIWEEYDRWEEEQGKLEPETGELECVK